MSDTRLTIVVTGGGNGIGAAVCDLMLSAGHEVHALDLNPHPDANVASHGCDVTDSGQLQQIAERIGPVNALILCAGINLRPRDNSTHRMDIDAWNRTLEVNLTGAMLTLRAFDSTLRAHGAIVTMASIAACRAMPGQDAYTASKGAIVAFNMAGAHPHDISTIIDRAGVAVRAGTHCAQPLLKRFGVTSTCRASTARDVSTESRACRSSARAAATRGTAPRDPSRASRSSVPRIWTSTRSSS